MPTEALPKDLAVFVTTGLYDFNYWPSRKIGSALNALGAGEPPGDICSGHTWLPGDVAMDAVSWLELQAMKKGTAEKGRRLDRLPIRGTLCSKPRRLKGGKTHRGL